MEESCLLISSDGLPNDVKSVRMPSKGMLMITACMVRGVCFLKAVSSIHPSTNPFFSSVHASLYTTIHSYIKLVHSTIRPSIFVCSSIHPHTRLLIHPPGRRIFIYSCIHLYSIRTSVHSSLHPPTWSPYIHPFMHPFILYPNICSSICPVVTYSSIHASIHTPLEHLFIHPFIHPPDGQIFINPRIHSYSIGTSVHPSLHPSARSLHIHQSTYPYVLHLNICTSIPSSSALVRLYLSIDKSFVLYPIICTSIHLFVRISVYPSIHASVCTSIPSSIRTCLSISIHS